MELLANLLYLYDATWSLEQEGARVVVGHAYHVMQQLPEDMKKPAIVRKIRKWLTLSELGHLLGEGPNIVESRKFGRSVLTDIRVCFFFKNINILEENPIKLSLFPPRCFQYYNLCAVAVVPFLFQFSQYPKCQFHCISSVVKFYCVLQVGDWTDGQAGAEAGPGWSQDEGEDGGLSGC